uniref:UDP-glucose 4-epimerase n=1 Tax=Panagrolaimus davidi TaxID=227884 RepID=A0A914QVW0_9BILA
MHILVTGGTGYIGSHCVLQLLQSSYTVTLCKKYGVKNLVFSSSVTVYGTSAKHPIKEDEATGAHPSGIIGEDQKGIPNNLVPYISQVINGKLPFLTIFGDDFNTSDGTCIRDYIHVMDTARANLCALSRIFKERHIGFETYNIGMGKGYSVLEVVKAMENASGKKIPIKIMPHRAGDVEYLCCDPTLASKNLKWRAQFDLDEMCQDVLNWQKKNPQGYVDEKHENLKNG